MTHVVVHQMLNAPLVSVTIKYVNQVVMLLKLLENMLMDVTVIPTQNVCINIVIQ